MVFSLYFYTFLSWWWRKQESYKCLFLTHIRNSSSHNSHLSKDSASKVFSPTILSTFYNIIIVLSPNAIIILTGTSNRMSHSGYINEKTGLSLRQNSSRKSTRNGQVKSCMFRIPWQSETSPVELVKDLAERVTNALRLISPRKSLHRGSSSLTRSKSAGSSVDSHRTAAVEDCIEFIHSSFSRSNSSTTAPRQDSIQAPWFETLAIMASYHV